MIKQIIQNQQIKKRKNKNKNKIRERKDGDMKSWLDRGRGKSNKIKQNKMH